MTMTNREFIVNIIILIIIIIIIIIAILNHDQKHSADGKVGDAEKEWARHFITTGFIALEQLLKTTAGTCCVGNTVTMADCCLVPQVYNAQRFSVDMTAFPLIARLNSNLSEKPEIEAAHPSMQPDCPADLK